MTSTNLGVRSVPAAGDFAVPTGKPKSASGLPVTKLKAPKPLAVMTEAQLQKIVTDTIEPKLE